MTTSDLITSFDDLVECITELTDGLLKERPRCWVLKSSEEQLDRLDDLNKVTSLYKDIWYQDGQDGRETRSCPGLIAGSTNLIESAQKVNQAKDELRRQVQLIQGDRNTWHSVKSELNKRHSDLRESMYYQGLARLHLKQTYRHIPILQSKPVKIGFSWYTGGRSIKKVSVSEAQNLLLNLDSQDEHIRVQLNKLNELPAETPLARVQNQAPVLRANMVFEKDVTPNRKAQNVSLPIIFPENMATPFPLHNTPTMEPPSDRDRLERSDLKIEREPFLKSIRVHKYKN